MNRIHTTLAITALCIGIVGWQVWQADSVTRKAPPSDSSVIPSQPPTTAAPAAAAAAEESKQLIEIDPTDFSARLQNDPNCHVDQVVLHPETGEPVEAIACDPVPEPRPYENWSEPVLAGLAYGDPVAAEVLGLRHIRSEDPNQEALGLMLLYRSVALSGDTEVLHRAIGARYAVVSENGTPNIHNLKQLLVFAVVTNRLGDQVMNAASIEARLAGADVAAGEVTELKSAAERILREMASIESEVTGNTTITEALTNA